MINLKSLKEEKEFYLKSFSDRNINLENEVNELIMLHDEYILFLNDEQNIRSKLNNITSEIKKDFDNKDLKLEAKNISDKAVKLKEKLHQLDEKIKYILYRIPNISLPDVPIGKNEDDNIILSSHLDDKKNVLFPKPHWETIEERKMVLLKEASFISGSRQVIYNDKAALVVKALERFMIDNAINDNGYTLIEPSVIVNKEALFNSGQLPKFEDDLFKLGEDQYLIPTGEVPLVNLAANKLLDEKQLPLKYLTSTSCFRKEAGSAGKDTRGLIRLHQFRKVELVIIGKPQEEKKDFESILKISRNVLDKLELPYRLVQICTGDLSFTSKKTIDIEVWMPGVGVYREISSVSCIGDFQSRRMKSRYKDSNNKKHFTYTYNGSALAIERTLAAIIENNRQENGMIKVPNALKTYLNFKEF